MTHKTIDTLVSGQSTHDGAGVKLRRILTSEWHQRLDPWLMLDEFGSDQANDYLAGFPAHPHRGFETITYMLAGRMAHGDNKGNRGIVEAGGVQWMRAGSGIIHEEMPAQESGRMQGFQFWLNLASEDKMTAPAWADVPAAEIPVVQAEGAKVKVIAGNFQSMAGPIQRDKTQPMILDINWQAQTNMTIAIPEGHHAFVYVYQQSVAIDGQTIMAPTMAVLSHQGTSVMLTAEAGSRALVVSGKPLNEPIAAGGPFVMNTAAQLRQALDDYRQGRF